MPVKKLKKKNNKKRSQLILYECIDEYREIVPPNIFDIFYRYYINNVERSNKKFRNIIAPPRPKIIDLIIKPQAKILDVGCRFGELLLNMAINGAQSVGLDIVPEHIKLLKIRAKKHNIIVHGVIGDGCHLPYRHNGFDYVIATEYFTHVHNFDRAMNELVRVLDIAGTLFIQDTLLNPLTLISLLRYGGITWLLTKSNTRKIYGLYVGKDEDVHSYFWWRKKLKSLNYQLKINMKTTMFGVLNPALHIEAKKIKSTHALD